MKKILVIGSSCVDIELIINRLPECGETVNEKNYCYIPGGSATNAALIFRQFNMKTAVCTALAEDSGGVRLKNYYNSHHIDSRFISRVEKSHTGLGVIIASEHASNRYVFYSGANDKLSAKDIDSAMDFNPNAVFLQLSLPYEAVIKALDICEERKIPVYCYTGHGDCFPIARRYDCVKLIVADEKTFSGLTGESFNEGEYVSNCVKLYDKFKAENIMIKMKSGNLLVYYRKFHYVITPHCEVTPRDLATSFDTLAAAAAASIIKGLEIREAAKTAVLVEEMTMIGTGSSASCPNMANVDKFIKDHGIENL